MYMQHCMGHKICECLALNGHADSQAKCSGECQVLSQPAAPEGLQCFTGWARWSPAAQRCLWRSQMHEAGLQLAELPMGWPR